MKIPYAVISVSNSYERIKNVKEIEKVFGYEKENIKFYDGRNNDDVLEFKKTFPNIDPNSYAKKRDGGPQSRPFNRAKGEAGIWMSNISAWKYVIDNDLDSLLLFEDDCIVEKEDLEIFFEKVKENNYDLYSVGLYAEALYFTNSGARKMLDAAAEQFQLCPFDEGLFNMHTSKKIISNGIAGYREQIDDWSKQSLINKDIIFIQSYHNPNQSNKIYSEISDSIYAGTGYVIPSGPFDPNGKYEGTGLFDFLMSED